MNKELFKKLTDNVSIGKEHPSLFKYDGEVCSIVCNRFPARDNDFRLESIEVDGDCEPYTDQQLLGADESKLTILIEQPCAT